MSRTAPGGSRATSPCRGWPPWTRMTASHESKSDWDRIGRRRGRQAGGEGQARRAVVTRSRAREADRQSSGRSRRLPRLRRLALGQGRPARRADHRAARPLRDGRRREEVAARQGALQAREGHPRQERQLPAGPSAEDGPCDVALGLPRGRSLQQRRRLDERRRRRRRHREAGPRLTRRLRALRAPHRHPALGAGPQGRARDPEARRREPRGPEHPQDARW